MNKYDRRHLANVKRYQAQVESIYKIAAEESARLAAGHTAPDDAIFSFDDSPRLQAAMDKLQQQMAAHLDLTITDGINEEWALSNAKNDALVNTLLGEEARQARYYRTNTEARDAFIARKEGGLALSDRVWRYTDQFKAEIEMGIDCGLREGLDAAQMARQLKQYLQHPDKLFRRVRDEHGNLRLSKAAAAYHPGQGVYRSSYKNARRLAATETNMAYRTADYERWQQLDFIVGIEVQLSNNHTCLDRKGKPKPFYDICDELKGKYPKEFKFTGWHPHCRCIATTILMTDAEMKARREARRNGEQPSDPAESENAVTVPPQEWFTWLKDNHDRAKTSYSVPYFLRDNEKFIPKGYIKLYASRMPYPTFAEYEAAMRYNKKHAGFSNEINRNNRELNKVMPVVQGKVMNVTEADGGHVNPKFNPEEAAYSQNCGTCVPTYVLRRRGFNVSAGKWVEGEGRVYDLYNNGCLIWQRADGTSVGWNDEEVLKFNNWVKTRSTEQSKTLKSFIETNADEPGIYMVRIGWVNGGGHFTTVELTKERNLIYYDPQSGKKKWLDLWESQAIPNKCWILRVDDKLIDPKFAECFEKS